MKEASVETNGGAGLERELQELARFLARGEEETGRLIGAGFSQDALDQSLMAAVCYTEKESSLEITRRLLAAGASPLGRVGGVSPLIFSLGRRRWTLAEELTRARTPEDRVGETVLSFAAGKGAPEPVLRALRDAGASLDGEANSIRTPLASAWASGQWETMRALLRLGADPARALEAQKKAGGDGWRADFAQEGRGILVSAMEAQELGRLCQAKASSKGPGGL